MSKTSKVLIGIMLAALCYMGAVRAYQFYEHKVEEQKAAQEQAPVFQHITFAADEIRPLPVKWQPAAGDVFLEEQPLSELLEDQEAKETLTSIFNDYRQNPALQQFNEDLKKATNGQFPDLESLSNQSLGQLVIQNPEIAAVVRKNMQSEDFQRVLGEIFSNPQFQQSVKHLQGGSLPQKTE